jgi:transposase
MKEKIHLEIQTSRKNPVGILRSSYRDENGKTKHKQYGRIKGKTFQELKMIQLAFNGKATSFDDPKAFKILQAKEYGASNAILKLIKQIDLHLSIYSRKEAWVESILAMIIGRIIYAGSKLSLCNQFDNSSLWELVGIKGRPDVEEDCYLPLDKLLERQEAIQKNLANKYLKNGHLVLYDITSSYLEGEYEDSELVKFGYNRDMKQGHKQIVIGLICNAEGCPVGVEIYPGNTKDETTVIEKINEIRNKYGIKKVIFVGDRGMVTKSNIEALKSEKDIQTITALTRSEINSLIEHKVIQPSLFDDVGIHEVIDPDNTQKRYCLCRNPYMAERSSQTRQKLIELIEEGMSQIQNYKQKTTVEILGSRIGKLLAKYKMGKFITWRIDQDPKNKISNEHKVIWYTNAIKVAEEAVLDGCYIITTNVSAKEMGAQEVVASYKKLTLVEQAFRNLKTVRLEMRPIYHKKDERIKAHVFLCMLAYHVQWHMQKRLKPLFAEDNEGKDRGWTFEGVIETLKQITRNKLSANGVEFIKHSEPTKDQEKILGFLQVEFGHAFEMN